MTDRKRENMQVLDFSKKQSFITPIEEIAAYETIWEQEHISFKKIAEMFREHPGSTPTDFVDKSKYRSNLEKVLITIRNLRENKKYRPNMLINGTIDYPKKLRDAREPIEILYYTGNLDLIYARSVAIVGTRNPSPEGIKRAEKLTKLLVSNGFTVVSGLAKGIDTVAHTTAIKSDGNTIAVIGTPLDSVYPKENSHLQDFIARKHLLISQVPFIRYYNQSFNGNRLFFPERNKTMSAITEATIIVEAGETSGTLIQARAAIHQGRKLFILNSCFENKAITWPKKYEEQGAIRVREFDDIITNLNDGKAKEDR